MVKIHPNGMANAKTTLFINSMHDSLKSFKTQCCPTILPMQITTVNKAKKILKKTNSASSLIVSSSASKTNQNKNILKDGANQRKRSGSLCLPSTTSGEFQVFIFNIILLGLIITYFKHNLAKSKDMR